MSPSQSNVYAAPLDDSPTLNDLRLGSYGAVPVTATRSTVGFTGIVLVAALAAGAVVMLDPLGMKASRTAAPGPAPLAMAPAITVPSAPPAADMNSQLATPVPAPALAPAKPIAEPEPVVTKSTPRASSPAPTARATVTKHRTTVTQSPDNNTSTTIPAPVAKSEPAETTKPAASAASAPTSSAPEAQGDSN